MFIAFLFDDLLSRVKKLLLFLEVDRPQDQLFVPHKDHLLVFDFVPDKELAWERYGSNICKVAD